MAILFPLFTVFLILVLYQKRNGWKVGPVSLICVVYLTMTSLAVFLQWAEIGYATYEISLVPMIYLSVMLALGFWGHWRFTDRAFVTVQIDNYVVYRVFEWALIALTFGSIMFFSPFAILSLQGDIASNRNDLGDLRGILGSYGILNTLFTAAANLFAFNLVCAFLNLSPAFGLKTRSVIRAFLLLIGSLSYVVYVFAYAGRDGVILWIMTFLFLFLMLRDFISAAAKRLVNIASMFVVLIMAIPFIIVTVSRFRESPLGIGNSLLEYGGGQIQNFNDHFIGFSSPQWGLLNFPIVYRLFAPESLELGKEFNRSEWYSVYTDLGIRPWTFSTYVGSFVQDVGPWLTPFLVLIVAMVARSSLKSIRTKSSINFSQLCVYVLSGQVLLYGVFYFRQGIVNSYVLLVLLLALVFKLSRRRAFVRSIVKGG